MTDDLISRLARTPSTTLRLEPYEPEPACDAHRPGHDEKPPRPRRRTHRA